jgi:predicted helicase
MEDPIIHFYETFLSEYDPKLRKARGVWYTPQPVVNFIVRAVDDILKTEFDLPQGLADNSKTKINIDVQGKKTEQEVHKVQILDPATGTGTFLAEVVKHIHKKFEGQQGIWSNYVETHLLPRLNGFELLMASYAMAHLKLDLLLTETGYKPTTNQRFRVYLTNSLEEHHQDTGTLFANWLSTEANEANHIKRDTPVMCVIGNPPYSGISSNNGAWISKLIEDYKYVDGVHFNERKHWLNDDYVKFLRYGQHFIEKNGSGVLAFINPHGFLDNPTFRGMRWHLLKTYDKIYTIDLHGNSKKKETAPDGSADINVFDIMQGVSINIFVKTGKKKANELGKVFHFDLYGKREMKYDFLSDNSLENIGFKELVYNKPFYFFVPKDEDGRSNYEKGFKPDELFITFNTGIVTGIDRLSIFKSKEELEEITDKILNAENPYTQYGIKDSRRTSKENRLKDLKEAKCRGIVNISYRPFDLNYMYLPDRNEYWINSPRIDVMQHFIKGNNIGIAIGRQGVVTGSPYWDVLSITNSVMDFNYFRRGGEVVFPLYLYPATNGQQTIGQTAERTPNLNPEIVTQIADKLGLTFTNEKEITKDTCAPIDILDYIYAVLHSPTYREKYKEFLKIDFPRVPYPKDKDTFWQLVKLGGQIRQIHLLESPICEQYITQYPVDGDNKVSKIKFVPYLYEYEVPDENGNFNYPDYLGAVYINDTQYFADVPTSAWEFYIGGYQPAQKWLKDRKGRTLEFDDILHYQKIIVALTETARIMDEINKINIV